MIPQIKRKGKSLVSNECQQFIGFSLVFQLSVDLETHNFILYELVTQSDTVKHLGHNISVVNQEDMEQLEKKSNSLLTFSPSNLSLHNATLNNSIF